jgi:pimeloyl-ACP methyl ester carboxylesterase
VFGISEGAPMCVLFAATYPARTEAVIMVGGYARRAWAARSLAVESRRS